MSSPATPQPNGALPDPPGASLAQALSTAISSAGWLVEEFDNPWRDVGWSLPCRRGAAQLEVCFVVDRLSFLQVAPRSFPGFVGRILGRVASATRADCFELATIVHRSLVETGRYGGFRWRWDGPPDAEHGDPEPVMRA